MRSPSTRHLTLAIALIASTALFADALLADANDCPKGCFCYPDASRLAVKCRHLTSPPATLPSKTAVLVLDGVPLSRLAPSTLHVSHLGHLEVFHCAGCGLQSVDLDAFKGLRALKIVDLADNDIAHLTADHFVDSPSLEVLDLAGNPRVDCEALAKSLPHALVNCEKLTSFDLQEQRVGPEMTSSNLKGVPGGQEEDTNMRLKRQAGGGAVTLPGELLTTTKTTELLPENGDECISTAWKVIAIVFIVLCCVSCFCNVLQCCCDLCEPKKRTAKGPQGNSTVYQLTTTELDDRYT